MAGLGRGLNALLQDSHSARKQNAQEPAAPAANKEPAAEAAGGRYSVVMVKTTDLIPSVYQPRSSFDDEKLEELTASIREHGLMQPLLVNRVEDGRYSIICGERRYRACRKLNLPEIPCVISEVQNTEGYALALIENIQREDLNPMEQSRALKRMIEECQLTQEELAKTLGLSRGAISHYLQLSRMHPQVQQLVEQGELSFSHAKVLFSLDAEKQLKAAECVVSRGLSVRKTEKLVKDLLSAEESPDTRPPLPAPSLARFADVLSERFDGAKVKFSEKGSTGRVVLSYSNAEQMQKIMQALGISQAQLQQDQP